MVTFTRNKDPKASMGIGISKSITDHYNMLKELSFVWGFRITESYDSYGNLWVKLQMLASVSYLIPILSAIEREYFDRIETYKHPPLSPANLQDEECEIHAIIKPQYVQYFKSLNL